MFFLDYAATVRYNCAVETILILSGGYGMSALLTKMLIFAVLLAIGYAGARRGGLDSGFTKGASMLILKVFIVASILNSVLGDKPELSSKELGSALLLLSLTIVLCYVMGSIVSRTLYRNSSFAPQVDLLISAVNGLFVGLPVLAAVVGKEGVFYMGISCIAFNLLLYTYGVWRMKQGNSEEKFRFRDLITIPLVGAVIATLVFLLDIKLPTFLTELISTVSGATIPMSMIVIGATLGKTKLKEAFTDKTAYVISFFSLIVCPLLTWLIIAPFTDNDVLRISCMVLAGSPCATIITPLTIRYGHDPAVSSKAIMVSTVLSMISLPLLIKVLF